MYADGVMGVYHRVYREACTQREYLPRAYREAYTAGYTSLLACREASLRLITLFPKVGRSLCAEYFLLRKQEETLRRELPVLPEKKEKMLRREPPGLHSP